MEFTLNQPFGQNQGNIKTSGIRPNSYEKLKTGYKSNKSYKNNYK